MLNFGSRWANMDAVKALTGVPHFEVGEMNRSASCGTLAKWNRVTNLPRRRHPRG